MRSKLIKAEISFEISLNSHESFYECYLNEISVYDLNEISVYDPNEISVYDPNEISVYDPNEISIFNQLDFRKKYYISVYVSRSDTGF